MILGDLRDRGRWLLLLNPDARPDRQGSALEKAPKSVLRLPREPEEIHRLGHRRPHRDQRLVQCLERLCTPPVVVVVGVDQRHEGTGVDQDHVDRFLIRRSRYFRPVSSDKSGGPPLTHPIRSETASNGCCRSWAASTSIAWRTISDFVWDLDLARRSRTRSVLASRRTL
ncbi:MAG TPA: hypothetical protein VGG06_31855, partial [Thermoanaerobaculia bacterium]